MKNNIAIILLSVLCALFYPFIYVYFLISSEKTKKNIPVLVLYTAVLAVWAVCAGGVYKYISHVTAPKAEPVVSDRRFVSIKPHIERFTETTTETTTIQTTTVYIETTTEPQTTPNEKYNIDCIYNYDGILAGKKGVYSGLWEGLEEKVSESSEPWAALSEWTGDISELRNCDYEEDNFKDINGYGTVSWSQGGHEWYYPYSCVGGSDWASASCGVCSVATVLSTLSGKAVTPPEVALAANALIGSRAWSGSILLTSGQAKLIEMAGFRVDSVRYENATKEKMDECLNANGMVIFVTSSQTWASGGNHYIVVRNLHDGLYYTSDSGKNPTEGFEYEEIEEGYNQQDVLYIYPKPLKNE